MGPRMLLREFLLNTLPSSSLSIPLISTRPPASLASPIPFPQLKHYSAYLQQLLNKYPWGEWVPPVELFQPYYGMTVGRLIAELHRKSLREGLRVVEIGGGLGTTAANVVGELRRSGVDLDSLLYEVYEPLDAAYEHCREKLAQKYPVLVEKKRLTIRNKSVLNTENRQHCVVLLVDVAGRMPHDKVYFCPETRQFRMAVIDTDTKQEDFVKLDDPLIERALHLLQVQMEAQNSPETNQQSMMRKLVDSVKRPPKKGTVFYLPTGFINTFELLKTHLDSFDLIVTGFDALPASLEGVNAPIVIRRTETQNTIDIPQSYLLPPQQYDIMFPINSRWLALLSSSLNHKSTTTKLSQLMLSHNLEGWLSQINPLQEDFPNQSIFISSHQ